MGILAEVADTYLAAHWLTSYCQGLSNVAKTNELLKKITVVLTVGVISPPKEEEKLWQNLKVDVEIKLTSRLTNILWCWGMKLSWSALKRKGGWVWLLIQGNIHIN